MLLGIEVATVVALAAAAGGIVAAIATAIRVIWEGTDRRKRTANGGRAKDAHPFLGVVRRGSRGRAVDEVQARLRERGWRVAVDGVFGPQTDRVVREFQAEKGLPVDGIVGPHTWNALWTATIT